MNIILYTTGCPGCRALRLSLDDNGVKYSICTDVDAMQGLGITSVPVLSVDGKLMGYNDAVEWVMNRGEASEKQQKHR